VGIRTGHSSSSSWPAPELIVLRLDVESVPPVSSENALLGAKGVIRCWLLR
jgi:hypothetical protein